MLLSPDFFAASLPLRGFRSSHQIKWIVRNRLMPSAINLNRSSLTQGGAAEYLLFNRIVQMPNTMPRADDIKPLQDTYPKNMYNKKLTGNKGLA